MIEKIEPLQELEKHSLFNKINELVDTVNELQNRIDPPSVYQVMKDKDAIIGKHIGEKQRLQDELDSTRKALDVAVDALKDIDKTRSVANHKIGTQDKTLNSGIVFCWTTPDEIHNALEQIIAEQKDGK